MARRTLLDDIDFPALEETSESFLPEVVSDGDRRWALIELALDEIVEQSPLQTRQEPFDPERYLEDAELLASVRQHGVIEPLLVQPLPAELGAPVRYRLLFGSRRLAAARLAGREAVPALVARATEDAEAYTVAENTGRRELTPYEKALALKAWLARKPGTTPADLAAQTGWALKTVYALLSAYEKSPPVLRRIFAEGQAAPRTIHEMQPIFARVPDNQHETLAELLAGRTHAEVVIVREAVRQDEDPLAVLRSFPARASRAADGGEILDTVAAAGALERHAADSPGTAPAPSRHPARQARTAPVEPVPDPQTAPDDAARVRELCEATGADRPLVARLLAAASPADRKADTLFLASRYLARRPGGAGDDASSSEAAALELARIALAHPRARGVLRRHVQHLRYLRAVRGWVADLPGEELRAFLATVLGG